MQPISMHLGDYKGELCVVDEYPLPREPTQMVLYWPTGIRVYDFQRGYGEGLMGRSVRYSGSSGLYSIDGTQLKIRLATGGQTKPIHSKKVPIPAPKVRKGVEVRYYDGRWEKYLKTKGWVSIPQKKV